MERLNLEDFQMYNFLSGVKLQMDGEGMAYLVSSADMEENGYSTDVYFVDHQDSRGSIRLTESGKVKSFAWISRELLAFTEYEKPTDDAPDGRTRVYTANIFGNLRGGALRL